METRSRVWGEGKIERAHKKILRMIVFIVLIMVMVSNFLNIYILSIYTSLYLSHTSIKLF